MFASYLTVMAVPFPRHGRPLSTSWPSPFHVMADLIGHLHHPRPRPGIPHMTYWNKDSARWPKPRAERKNDYISIDLRDSHPEVS